MRDFLRYYQANVDTLHYLICPRCIADTTDKDTSSLRPFSLSNADIEAYLAALNAGGWLAPAYLSGTRTYLRGVAAELRSRPRYDYGNPFGLEKDPILLHFDWKADLDSLRTSRARTIVRGHTAHVRIPSPDFNSDGRLGMAFSLIHNNGRWLITEIKPWLPE